MSGNGNMQLKALMVVFIPGVTSGTQTQFRHRMRVTICKRPPTWMLFPKAPARSASWTWSGSVWQWTDEYEDTHTRAAILRGGSYYHPQGSKWYFPNSAKLDEHGKLLLMYPGKDRAGTLGFRCVLDSQ